MKYCEGDTGICAFFRQYGLHHLANQALETTKLATIEFQQQYNLYVHCKPKESLRRDFGSTSEIDRILEIGRKWRKVSILEGKIFSILFSCNCLLTLALQTKGHGAIPFQVNGILKQSTHRWKFWKITIGHWSWYYSLAKYIIVCVSKKKTIRCQFKNCG